MDMSRVCLRCGRRAVTQKAARSLSTSAKEDRAAQAADAQDTAPAGAESSASAYLRRQADREERSAVSKNSSSNTQADPVWDGDERIKDAVLRMLVDKYKPLRVEGWEKKIQKPTERAPEDSPSQPKASYSPPTDRPLFPWEHITVAPKHHLGVPSVRKGLLVPRPGSKKNSDIASRVAWSREAAFDYRDGDRQKAKRVAAYQQQDRRPMGSIKNWTNIVEDRIQRAREEGLFRDIKGRGKPFARDWNESNPYIDTTSFLMNRIVQRQAAAPAWIELQQQVDAHLHSFRNAIREAWSRRAIRMLSIEGQGVLTPGYIARSIHYRDEEWLNREKAYHESSIKVINDAVRVYNTIAPYSVRRNYYVLDEELESCFEDCKQAIKTALEKRAQGAGKLVDIIDDGTREVKSKLAEKEERAVHQSMWQAFKAVVRDMVAKPT